MRTVLHDWPESHATTILRRLREVAHSNTSLIIADHLPAHACAVENTDGPIERRRDGPAPAPLLPNFGIANSLAYTSDMNVRSRSETCLITSDDSDTSNLQMLVLFNAQERTMEELTRLAGKAGWAFESVYYEASGFFGHIVAVPV